MCSGWAGASALATDCNDRENTPCQPSALALALLSHCEIVDGNRIRDEAKIGGITPAMLSFSGRCELWFM